MTAEKLDYSKYIVPLVTTHDAPESGQWKTRRYVGCSYWISSSGLLASCQHVFADRSENEHLLAIDLGERKSHRIQSGKVQIHPSCDFAVAVTDAEDTSFFQPWCEDLHFGLDVHSLGFTIGGRWETGEYCIDPRLLKGHIVRLLEEDRAAVNRERPNARSICELSYPSLSGFSGAPVITAPALGRERYLVGMLYDNMESRIRVSDVEEVTETTTTPTERTEVRSSERIHRVHEFGLAHTIADVRHFLAEMNIDGAFE